MLYKSWIEWRGDEDVDQEEGQQGAWQRDQASNSIAKGNGESGACTLTEKAG